MEQHPVPQNVTTFQFRLIGDMTIKQFGYLAGGAILAYISYKLPLPLFLNWPLAFIFGLGGFGFAFIPVEERPMDVWFFSFLKSVYSPTQFLWQKGKPTPAPTAVAAAPKPTTTTVEIKLPQPPTPPVVVPPTPIPIVNPINPTVVVLEEKIKNLAAEKATSEANEERFVNLQKQLTDSNNQRLRLEQELMTLKRRLTPPGMLGQNPMGIPPIYPARMQSNFGGVPPNTPVSATLPLKPATTPPIRLVPPTTAQSVGLPKLTTFANVITGIVKDNEGNLLPGILITVRDTEGVPLRALKTNKLGQFGASTPLPNGTFIIEAEDPRGRFTFEQAKLPLRGEVMPPLEIRAKSQKELDRNKLEKQIFGKLD